MGKFSQKIAFLLVLVAGITSCSELQKALKSNDVTMKKNLAIKYFNEKTYNKAYILIDDIYPVLRTSSEGAKLGYMYAYCEYELGNNLMASYRFKLLYESYPFGEYAEEALYMYAFCLFSESPPVSLDQTITMQAIDAIQLFINRYPESKRIDDCNKYMDELLKKIEDKAIADSKIYYKIEDYKAALWSLKNVLDNYPMTERKAEIQFLILDSYYKLAINSVETKKEERLNDTKSYYLENKTAFEASDFANQAENIFKSVTNQLKNLDKK